MSTLHLLEVSTVLTSIVLSYATSESFHGSSPDSYFDSNGQFNAPAKGFATVTLPPLVVLVLFLAAIKRMGLPYEPGMLIAILYPGLLAGLIGAWRADIPHREGNTEESSDD